MVENSRSNSPDSHPCRCILCNPRSSVVTGEILRAHLNIPRLTNGSPHICGPETADASPEVGVAA